MRQTYLDKAIKMANSAETPFRPPTPIPDSSSGA